MKKFLVPDGYEAKGCILIQYSMPFLRNCFSICQMDESIIDREHTREVYAFIISEAFRLSEEHGSKDSFVLFLNGYRVRKRANLHASVILTPTRLHKAWAHALFALKNVFTPNRSIDITNRRENPA